jgi:predicted Zn-dependent peptidase
MFKGKAYGTSKCGTIEQVEAISGKSLYNAWRNMIESAFIRIQVISSQVPSGLFEELGERFSRVERKNITNCKKSEPCQKFDDVLRIEERQDINQGKLVMGFSSETFGNDDKTLALLVTSDIFGGGPYSRLFSNVREKMSLCYYCSASTVRQKGLLTVDSGVETANAKKAEEEILNQLNIVKSGQFSDFEFESSIKSICDSFKSYNDSQNSLDTWYAVKVNNDELYSPSDLAEKVKLISREDVIKTAKGIKLEAVYKLLPKEAK